MVGFFKSIRQNWVATLIAAALLCVPYPGFSDCCTSVHGSPTAQCHEPVPDTGVIFATGRTGATSGSFSWGELQMHFNGDWHYYDNSSANNSLGSGSFDCPDGGSTESWGARYDFDRLSALVSDTYTFKVRTRSNVSGCESYGDYNNFTFNCP